MFSAINGAAVLGIDGYRVRVEVDIARGLTNCYLVGLPDGAIRESIKRVQSATRNSDFEWPDGKKTINLAPAGLRKDGTGFDLPIALAVLVASRQAEARDPALYESSVFVGELSLDGSVLPVPGVLPRATLARDMGVDHLIVPRQNAPEAAVVSGLEVIPVDTLVDAVDWLEGCQIETMAPVEPSVTTSASYPFDFQEVRGQAVAKRALEIAAAGGHNALMVGPPGAGKTMLARRMVTILPPLDFVEAIETTKVYSVASALDGGRSLMTERPFCAPHFTISEVGLVGGGVGVPRPGQISLAHNGVLFLDELLEFPRHVLEVMRGPLEDKEVTLTRGMTTVTYPASIMLIAAMNPCPCGYYGSTKQECSCTYVQVQSYRQRMSGPLLDRIDLHAAVSSVGYADLVSERQEETSGTIRVRVEKARHIQRDRFSDAAIHCNAEMEPKHLKAYCQLDADGHRLMERCIDVLCMSARGYSRILKVARTIADLAGAEFIRQPHIAEAVGYRLLDVETAGANGRKRRTKRRSRATDPTQSRKGAKVQEREGA